MNHSILYYVIAFNLIGFCCGTITCFLVRKGHSKLTFIMYTMVWADLAGTITLVSLLSDQKAIVVALCSGVLAAIYQLLVPTLSN